ncbi:MAG: glycosyltransferase [Arcobacter sp.]|uniref:glycosyltransferase family 2 protein n=1 Tax=Arcobacter sp. TaxID=1872629 RepID=UPI003C744598
MINKRPFISVLINNYNYAPFIEQAIDSVLNQTYDNFELIIVDDGSTDQSIEVLNKIKHPKIKTILKENGGQASAFNVGFEASSGEIITFLDSDDWWKEDKLDAIVNWHIMTNGEYSLIQHAVDVWDNGITYPYKYVLNSGDFLQQMVETGEIGTFVGTSGLTFKRETLEKVMPVPLDFRISADAYLTRTSFTQGFVYSIPRALGYYRKHNNAVLGNKSVSHRMFHEEILFPNLNNFYRKNNITFRIDATKYYTKEINDAVANKLLLLFIMRKKFEEIFSKYSKIAIYGAGDHTIWLAPILNSFPKDKLVAILDANAKDYIPELDLQPIKSTDFDKKSVDAIVISTIYLKKEFTRSCKELYGDNMPLIDLYEVEQLDLYTGIFK